MDVEDEDDDFFDSDEDEDQIDYRQQIIQAEMDEAKKQAIRTGEVNVSSISIVSDIAQRHFIFKQAHEAAQLLDITFQQSPKLRYSAKIQSIPELCTVRIEMDLAFYDISDHVLFMLGLKSDEPITITISLNENTILNTEDATFWTRKLLGAMSYEVYQGGSMDSYGCKEYIKGRVVKYIKEIYDQLETNNPPMLSLSRENSVEVNYSNQ